MCQQLGYYIEDTSDYTFQSSVACKNPGTFGLDDLNCDSTSYQHISSCYKKINSHNCSTNSECFYLDCGNKYLCGNQICTSDCNPRCKSCNSNKQCIQCFDGMYLPDQNSITCLDCDNSACATCINQSNECILECNPECKTCSLNQQCQTCHDGMYLSGQNLITCLDCDNSVCATCINQSNECILECNSECKTCSNNKQCQSCHDGMYLSGQNLITCLDCDNSVCATCINQSNECILECNPECKTCSLNQQCQSCHDGMYLSGENLITCLDCDNSVCATCINQSNECILECNPECKTCSNNKQCQSCHDGMYLSGENLITCLDCDNSVCATCINQSNECILECNPECKTCSLNQQCQTCHDGMYLSGQNLITCLDCDNSVCATCINQSNECILECNSECKTCSNNKQCQSCHDGMYLSGQNLITCLDCDNSVCATCINQSNECILECNSECKTCSNNKQCQSCHDGMYLSGQNLITCLDCDSVCATCINQSNECILECNPECKTCSLNQQCQSCHDGMYLSGENLITCLDCDNSVCATCINQSNECILECNSECKTCSNNKQCQSCHDGMYLSGQNLITCLDCDNSVCATCINQSNECILECNPECKTCSLNQQCQSCHDGMYLSGENLITCLDCDNSVCATCINQSNECILECNSECKTCSNNKQCQSCHDGMYLSGQNLITCLDCDNSACATCINQSNECILECNPECKTCSLNQQCQTCHDGMYLSGQNLITCLDCDNSVCATCINQSNECILECNSECKTCSNNKQCQSCHDGMYLSGQNLITCLDCDNSVCATCINQSNECILECNPECKTCSNNQQCQSCHDGMYLSGQNLITCLDCDNSVCATCINQSNECILECNSECKTCSNNKQCQSCHDGMYLSGQNLITCLDCDNSVCATCINQSNECILECNSECKTCSNNKQCQSCHDGMYLSGQNLITCLDCDNSVCATCINQSNECILECNPECKTCSLNQQCQSCHDGMYLSGENFVTCLDCDNSVCATCINQSNECILECNPECKTCSNNKQCQQCHKGYFLLMGSCFKCNNQICGTCIQKDDQCIIKCHNSCQTCRQDGKCLTCPEKFFLDINLLVCKKEVKILISNSGRTIYF